MINLSTIIEKHLKLRDIIPTILPWLNERECILIVGSRQVGKTSLLYLLVQHLYEQKQLSDRNFCFLDLEDPGDLELAGLGPDDLLKALRLRGKQWDQNKPLYLILDEIHLLNDPARLIKLFVDHYPMVSLLATGSSSTAIRQKFSDSLPGRKQEFLLLPLSFGEYLEFNGKPEYKKYLFSLKDIVQRRVDLLSSKLAATLIRDVQSYFEEYLVYGGYPGITLTDDDTKKKRRLGSIFNDYVRKDIGSLFSIEYLNEYTRLVKLLATRSGGLLTYAHLASALGVNQRTLKRYLDILEATFIIYRLYPYKKNIGKRLIKTPKSYFYDNGLRNITLGDFAPFNNRTDQGGLIESIVFQNLLRKIEISETFNLSFWRTSAGGEVDFIWNDILIEVKSGQYLKNPPRSLVSCMNATGMNKAIILNKSRIEYLKDQSREIFFFPYSLLQ